MIPPLWPESAFSPVATWLTVEGIPGDHDWREGERPPTFRRVTRKRLEGLIA